MIEADEIAPRIGELLHIQFAGCNKTRCTVRWIKERRIGVEFEQQTDIVGLAKTRAYVVGAHQAADGVPERMSKPMAKRATRHGLIWNGTLYWSFEAFSVRLRNISTDGAMLECDQTITPGLARALEPRRGGTLTGEGAVVQGRSGRHQLRREVRSAPARQCQAAIDCGRSYAQARLPEGRDALGRHVGQLHPDDLIQRP
jgi:hypothetical protein